MNKNIKILLKTISLSLIIWTCYQIIQIPPDFNIVQRAVLVVVYTFGIVLNGFNLGIMIERDQAWEKERLDTRNKGVEKGVEKKCVWKLNG